ncbi:MAG: hypothetical protein K5905_31100, partial [Roseibium sp.]|uniref:hypothetical protein n=1 Tax=Roseibium sp. TaxID=1936156 RepID=UPI00261DED4F
KSTSRTFAITKRFDLLLQANLELNESDDRKVKDMCRTVFSICGLLLVFSLGACAVGPGTPLVDAVRSDRGPTSSNVPVPEGYGLSGYPGKSSGLINPEEREATQVYLESLATQ